MDRRVLNGLSKGQVAFPTAGEQEVQSDCELKEQYGMNDKEIMVGQFVKEFRKSRHEQA